MANIKWLINYINYLWSLEDTLTGVWYASHGTWTLFTNFKIPHVVFCPVLSDILRKTCPNWKEESKSRAGYINISVGWFYLESGWGLHDLLRSLPYFFYDFLILWNILPIRVVNGTWIKRKKKTPTNYHPHYPPWILFD